MGPATSKSGVQKGELEVGLLAELRASVLLGLSGLRGKLFSAFVGKGMVYTVQYRIRIGCRKSYGRSTISPILRFKGWGNNLSCILARRSVLIWPCSLN